MQAEKPPEEVRQEVVAVLRSERQQLDRLRQIGANGIAVQSPERTLANGIKSLLRSPMSWGDAQKMLKKYWPTPADWDAVNALLQQAYAEYEAPAS